MSSFTMIDLLTAMAGVAAVVLFVAGIRALWTPRYHRALRTASLGDDVELGPSASAPLRGLGAALAAAGRASAQERDDFVGGQDRDIGLSVMEVQAELEKVQAELAGLRSIGATPSLAWGPVTDATRAQAKPLPGHVVNPETGEITDVLGEDVYLIRGEAFAEAGLDPAHKRALLRRAMQRRAGALEHNLFGRPAEAAKTEVPGPARSLRSAR